MMYERRDTEKSHKRSCFCDWTGKECSYDNNPPPSGGEVTGYDNHRQRFASSYEDCGRKQATTYIQFPLWDG